MSVRPPLTPRLEYALARLVAAGVPLSRAARELGIRPRTARSWFELSRRPSGAPRYRRFGEAIADARLEHEIEVQRVLADLRGRSNGH